MAVVVCEPHEGSYFCLAGGCGEFLDSLDLGGICTDAFLVDQISEELDFVAGKRAFLGLEEESILSHPVEDFLKDVEVLFKGGGEDRDIIHVNEADLSDE